MNQFEGVFALLLTPFLTDGRIDWSTYDQYVDWQLSLCPHGLFAVCGSSEMFWLELDERLALAKRAVERAGDVPVVATANLAADRTRHVDEMAQMAETGVAGFVLVPPAGLGENQEQLEAYFATLADQSPLPVILYEWPQMSPYEIDPSVYGRLVADHGIVGIKDTTCTLTGIGAKYDAAPESIIYQANTPYLLDAFEMGARGTMAITSTAAADISVRLWDAVSEQTEDAESYYQQLVFLDALLRYGYPASAKCLAQLRGLPFELTCRAPSVLQPEGAKAMTVWWNAYQRS
jgi:4-hydroxy-tetrahydrodipicolinate synthase